MDFVGSISQLTENADALAVTHEVMIIASAVMIVMGLLMGLLGLKLVRILSALTCFIIGAVVGGVAGTLLNMSDTITLAVWFICAIAFGIAGFVLRKVGIFIWVFFAIVGIVTSIVKLDNMIFIIAGAVLGLIVAVLAMIFFEPVIIIVTSLVGADSVGAGALALIGMSGNWIVSLAVMIVLAILFTMAQFGLRSREIKKKEIAHANEYREKESRETEIEMARKLLDDDDL